MNGATMRKNETGIRQRVEKSLGFKSTSDQQADKGGQDHGKLTTTGKTGPGQAGHGDSKYELR